MSEAMKILLTNNDISLLGGTEIWLFTMAKELAKKGHKVEVFSWRYGKMAEKIKPYAKLVKGKMPNDYDLALVNHNSTLIAVPENVKKICTSHGIIPPLEQPIKGADRYVAVSEEVQLNLQYKGFLSTVIRNPIDTDRYKKTKPIRKKLKNILLLTNHGQRQSDINEIKKACDVMNLKLNIIGIASGTVIWDIEKLINDNDVVISLGRGIYQAMACERPCIVWGQQGGDGWVSENYFESRIHNCSGRRFGTHYNYVHWLKLFERYNPKAGKTNRELVLKYHNLKKICDKYLEL